MAKKTAIIDIGSNGVRMAIFERTSRFGFYILHEQKIKFRLSKNRLANGCIANEQITKLAQIIDLFTATCKQLKVKKIQAIGTSALREAANCEQIKSFIAKKCGINIKNINGELEASLAGFGALNLLPPLGRAISLDIGGGSAELCLIEGGRVQKTASLDLGTVRLKELFDSDYKECDRLIKKTLEALDTDFCAPLLVAVGGSLRAISGAIMQHINYPLKSLHGFRYELAEREEFIRQIAKGGSLDGIKKERYDTIRVGALVFLRVAAAIGARSVITSGAGVREGLFLRGILGRHARLPAGFNPSLRSLEDRFIHIKSGATFNTARALFDALAPLHFLPERQRANLLAAARAAHIGKHLSFYSKHAHSGYFVRAGLNFCIEHTDKATIATIIELHGKKFDYDKLSLKPLLPDENALMWLSFMLAFCRIICATEGRCTFNLREGTIEVAKENFNPLTLEQLRKIYRPKWLAVRINGLDF